MKLLFIGATITWDALAVAQGYLEQTELGSDYGNYDLEKVGQAFTIGIDDWGRDIWVLGSTRPVLIKKIVAELIKVGYPWAQEVEVIAFKLPGQRILLWLLAMASWPVLGKFIKPYINIWAERFYGLWWQEGRKIWTKLNHGCDKLEP